MKGSVKLWTFVCQTLEKGKVIMNGTLEYGLKFWYTRKNVEMWNKYETILKDLLNKVSLMDLLNKVSYFVCTVINSTAVEWGRIKERNFKNWAQTEINYNMNYKDQNHYVWDTLKDVLVFWSEVRK